MKIFGSEVQIPAPFDRYLSIKRSFKNRASQIYSEIIDRISDQKFADAWKMSNRASIHEGAIRWGKAFGREKLEWIADLGVQMLSREGNFDYDVARYKEDFMNYDEIDRCSEDGDSINTLREIEEDEYALESRRHERTCNARNRWSGGTLGGGLSGALKGALKAEILNVSGALISGALNTIDRRMSRKSRVEKSHAAFVTFQIELAGAIRDAVLINLEGLVSCMRDVLGDDITSEWPILNESKASGLLGNLRAGRVPAAIANQVYGALICADPFKQDSYEWLYLNARGKKREVTRLATYFCVDIEAGPRQRQA